MEAEPEQKRPRTRSLSPACISKVLDIEHLLEEIMKHIRHPLTLVRAALVCKKWYRRCSDPDFLKEFVENLPRRLLGYFVMLDESEREFLLFKEIPERAGGVTRFLSVSFPPNISRSCVLEEIPELACVSRFLSSTFPEGPCEAVDYRNGHVLLDFGNSLAICHPLHQMIRMLPPLLTLPYRRGWSYGGEYFLLSEDGLSVVHVRAVCVDESLVVDLACLNGDKWTLKSNSIVFQDDEQSERYEIFSDPALLVNGCVFMVTIIGCMVEVNLENCQISLHGLPVTAYYQWGFQQLSRVQGPGLFYVHADGYNIQIWLHREGAWMHYNTIDLPAVFACSNMPWSALHWKKSRAGWGEVVTIYGIGDAAEFMILGIAGNSGMYLLDVRSSIVVMLGEKYSEEKGEALGNRIIPFLTSCPPVFPQMRGDKIDIKTLQNAIVEGNKYLIRQLQTISLDEEESVKNFIKTRYRSTARLIWSIDDCLTVIHSVAALPVVEGERLQHRIHRCRRLTKQWGEFILKTNSLRKKVASVDGVYFQAEVNGQTVTWQCPHARRLLFWLQFNVDLLIFDENCLELLLDSVDNSAGALWGERDPHIPSFQYSETVKMLRSIGDNLECTENVNEVTGFVDHANV